MAFVKVDGSIASLFLQCQQNLTELRDILREIPQDAQDAREHQRCCDEIGRLGMWDLETGAQEGHLDHALRRSSMLRDGVLKLLQELVELSAQGTCNGPSNNFSLLTKE